MNPYRNGTQRQEALTLLAERGPMESAEFSEVLGVAPGRLASVIRDSIQRGIIRRERVDDRCIGFRYSLADEVVPLEAPPTIQGRYPSVWGYAQGVET